MPKRYGGAGHSLDHIKDRAVAAADNNGIVTFGDCPLCLGSGRAVFACLHDIDRGARLAEGTG